MYFARYQELAIEARNIFLQWNEAIKNSAPSDLPAGLTPEDEVLNLCGSYFLAHGREMPVFFKESLEMMEKTAPSARALQFVKV
jgi:sarcosine oxidase/L-pipecolate oxidase